MTSISFISGKLGSMRESLKHFSYEGPIMGADRKNSPPDLEINGVKIQYKDHLYNLAKSTLSKTYLHENVFIRQLDSCANELFHDGVYRPTHSLLWNSDSKLLSL